MPSRNLDVILLDDFNIGAEGVDQVVTLSVTGPLTIVPRTFYLIDNSTAADIVITVANAGNAGAYAFFGIKKSSTGNAVISSASLINGITSQTISVNNEGFGVEDTGTTYNIARETRSADTGSLVTLLQVLGVLDIPMNERNLMNLSLTQDITAVNYIDIEPGSNGRIVWIEVVHNGFTITGYPVSTDVKNYAQANEDESTYTFAISNATLPKVQLRIEDTTS